MSKLKTNVHVTDAQGRAFVFGPDDDVPEWAEILITNSKAWAEPPVRVSRLAEPAPKSAPAKKAAAKRAPARRKAAPDGPAQ